MTATPDNVIDFSARVAPTSDKSCSDAKPDRYWRASIDLTFEARATKTVLTRSGHNGPLRVQRPFYPAGDESCHLYLLHPPGGMVIGDDLYISAEVKSQAQALITTPSAGRIYSAKGASYTQNQSVHLKAESKACLEWLPQETIVFDGANGVLNTRIDLAEDALAFVWDIVRLGRRASAEEFDQGTCRQAIEVWREDRLIFCERNHFVGGEEFMAATWGMQNLSTSGTLLATLTASRETIDEWVELLNTLSQQEKYGDGKNLWGLTQKGDMFIARFMGDSITLCRDGFKLLWQQARPFLNNKVAVVPRIWNT